jgi:MFS transporter, DHA1 family, multidrug resistance protein
VLGTERAKGSLEVWDRASLKPVTCNPLPRSENRLLKRLWAKYGQLYLTYHTLIYLSIVAAVAELAYGVINQSAIPPYVQQIGLTAHIGVIYATFLVVETIFKSPMGHLGDRWGRRPLIVGGAATSAVTALLTAMTRNLPGLLALRAIDGIASAAIWPTMIAAIGGSVKPEKRTTAMSALTVVYIAGVSLGPLVGGIANDSTHSKLTSFYVVSVLFVFTALVALFLTPHRSREEALVAEEEHPPKFSDVMLGIKSVPDMMVLAFLAFFAIGIMIPIVKLFAMDELGLSETGYGKLIFPIAIGVAVASLGAGHLGDRWGKVRSVRLGIILTSAAMWAVVFAHSALHMAVAGIVLGIGFVIAMPAWLALVSDMAAPRMRGAVIGALGTSQGFGAVAGAALGSYLYTSVRLAIDGLYFSPHRSPFAVSAMALTACIALVFVFMREGDKRCIGAENGNGQKEMV